jgi:cytochrome c biogenesis protein CcmG/thiol:disulfide interchange protein DsbE
MTASSDEPRRLMSSGAQRAAQAASVVVVIALLGLLVYKTTHNKVGKLASVVDSGRSFKAYPFAANRVGAAGRVSLASLRGKVVVLNFWQSYCPPCTAEAPVVSAVSKQWAGKNVVFVGVDEQDLSGPATAFMKRFHITYPVIPDSGPLIGHYGVTGYPETFFIDKRGVVVPLPPNKSGQVGHIVGGATSQLLDLGIKTALTE